LQAFASPVRATLPTSDGRIKQKGEKSWKAQIFWESKRLSGFVALLESKKKGKPFPAACGGWKIKWTLKNRTTFPAQPTMRIQLDAC
jgi:hypothetical protein